MLLYVEGKSFLGRTFVVMCDASDTVARIKAKLLHSLNDWGKSAYQFRLRYKAGYLQDAVSLESQGVVDNAVVYMLPLSANDKVDTSSIRSKNSLQVASKRQDTDVLGALHREVAKLERRSLFMNLVKFLIYFQLLLVPLMLASQYWWAGVYSGVFALYGLFYKPQFYYVGGVATVPNILHFRFVAIFSGLSSATAVATTVLWMLLLTSSDKLLDGCRSASAGQDLSLAADSCSSQVWFSGILYPVHALVNMAAMTSAVLLGLNLRFKIGDRLETVLLELKDIAQWIAVARSAGSSSEEKQEAAAHINSFVATSDDAKFQVVELEGLLTLINLSLMQNEEAQVLATEALAMMLEVPAIQSEFIGKNGFACLGALMRSPRALVQLHACRGLSLIVADSAENAALLVEGNSLSDLANAMSSKTAHLGAHIASILNNIIAQSPLRNAIREQRDIFSAIVRESLQAGESESEVLTAACLHCLGVLAKETPAILVGQEDIVDSLLAMPHNSGNLDILVPATKLLLCFAENASLPGLLPLADMKNTLALLVSTRDDQLMRLVLETIDALSAKNSAAMSTLGFNQIVSEILQVAKVNMAARQEQEETQSMMADVDTRADFDKELGTGENPVLDEVDGEDNDATDDVTSNGGARPLLETSEGPAESGEAENYPAIRQTAQNLLSTLSLNAQPKLARTSGSRVSGKKRKFQRGVSSYSLLSTGSRQ